MVNCSICTYTYMYVCLSVLEWILSIKLIRTQKRRERERKNRIPRLVFFSNQSQRCDHILWLLHGFIWLLLLLCNAQLTTTIDTSYMSMWKSLILIQINRNPIPSIAWILLKDIKSLDSRVTPFQSYDFLIWI